MGSSILAQDKDIMSPSWLANHHYILPSDQIYQPILIHLLNNDCNIRKKRQRTPRPTLNKYSTRLRQDFKKLMSDQR